MNGGIKNIVAFVQWEGCVIDGRLWFCGLGQIKSQYELYQSQCNVSVRNNEE